MDGDETMKNRFTKNQILTIPNLLSLFRLLLIPIIVWFYCVPKNYLAAIIFIAISAATDIIDGRIARKFNMVSDIGKVLDPIADKCTQGAMIICLISKYHLMVLLIILFIIKESLMLFCGYITLKVTDTVNSARWFGKVNTAVLYGAMMALILFPNIPQIIADILIFICIGFVIMSLLMYVRFYVRILKEPRNITAD